MDSDLVHFKRAKKKCPTMEAEKKLLDLVSRSKTLGINIANLPAIKRHSKLYRGSKRKCFTICAISLLITYLLFIVKIKNYNCFVDMPSEWTLLFRPILTCEFCENVTAIERIANVSPEDFEQAYAYSGAPVVITDATTNWTAHNVNFFLGIH